MNLLGANMRVEINMDALRANIEYVKALCDTTIPVLKGNCYGLGKEATLEIAKNFAVVSVHSIQEAEVLRASGYKYEIIVLGGIDTRSFNGDDQRIIPVLNSQQVPKANIQYAIFSDYGCRRLNVSPDVVRIRDPEYLLYHGFHYERFISVSSCVADSDRYRCPKAKLSIGSTTNLLHAYWHISPRVGLAFAGFDSSGKENSSLQSVKSVYARVIDCVSKPGDSSPFGYEIEKPDVDSYVYSIDAGTYDNIYQTVDCRYLRAVTRDSTPIELISGRSAVGMNMSFIQSRTPIEVGSEVELLGANVSALDVAAATNTSIANVLRIGSNVN